MQDFGRTDKISLIDVNNKFRIILKNNQLPVTLQVTFICEMQMF